MVACDGCQKTENDTPVQKCVVRFDIDGAGRLTEYKIDLCDGCKTTVLQAVENAIRSVGGRECA